MQRGQSAKNEPRFFLSFHPIIPFCCTLSDPESVVDSGVCAGQSARGQISKDRILRQRKHTHGLAAWPAQHTRPGAAREGPNVGRHEKSARYITVTSCCPTVYHPMLRCLPPHAPLPTTPCPAVYHPMPRCLPPHAPLPTAPCPAVEIFPRTLCLAYPYLALGGGCSLLSSAVIFGVQYPPRPSHLVSRIVPASAHEDRRQHPPEPN